MQIISDSKCPKNINGILSTLTFIGEECDIWQSDRKTLFDMVDEKNPSVIFTIPEMGNELLAKAKQENNIKIAYFGIGNTNLSPDVWCLPTNTPKQQVDIISEHCSCFLMPRFADIAKYYGGKRKKEYEYDALYYSDVEISNDKIQLINQIYNTEKEMCVVGPHPIPLPCYLGDVKLKTLCDLIVSCKAGLDFDGLHDLDFAFLGLPIVRNITDLDILLKDEQDRLKTAEKQKSIIINNELTSFSVTQNLMRTLSIEIGDKIKEKIKCLNLVF